MIPSKDNEEEIKMYDKAPTSSAHEKILDENIGELTVSQMNDIVTTPEYDLYPEDGSFSQDRSKRLSDWVKENDGNLEAILAGIGYYSEELTEANIRRLKLCLMTPRHIYAKDHKNRTGDNSVTRELAEYHEVLREAVKANPAMGQKELSMMLHGAAMWANMPDAYRTTRARLIESAVNGVRGELAMEQVAQSEAIKAAGISFQQTSAEEDVKGIDLRLLVPIQRKTEVVMVPMGVDVKSDHHQILDLLGPNDEIKPYVIKNGKVILWDGTTRNDLNGPLMLDNATAEKRGAALTSVLQEAAEELYEAQKQYRLQKRMGGYGLRSA